MSEPMKAQCRCGQLTAECRGEPTRISVCHCHACQLRTGSVFATQIRFPADTATIAGESRSWGRIGDSGGQCTYHFCETCGSTVFYVIDLFPGVIAIPMGAFAGAELPRPWVSVYEQRKVPWVELVGDIKHHD